MKGLFWLIAFLFSLVFLAAVYYVTYPTARAAIDARAPWVASYLRPFVRETSESKASPKATPAPEAAERSPEPIVASVPPPPVVPVEPEPFDLAKLATNRAAWPAKVMINKPTAFPAVVNGKVLGSVIVPAGTEVGLTHISNGKLGVDYQGGVAWLAVEETDVVVRTQKKRN